MIRYLDRFEYATDAAARAKWATEFDGVERSTGGVLHTSGSAFDPGVLHVIDNAGVFTSGVRQRLKRIVVGQGGGSGGHGGIFSGSGTAGGGGSGAGGEIEFDIIIAEKKDTISVFQIGLTGGANGAHGAWGDSGPVSGTPGVDGQSTSTSWITATGGAHGSQGQNASANFVDGSGGLGGIGLSNNTGSTGYGPGTSGLLSGGLPGLSQLENSAFPMKDYVAAGDGSEGHGYSDINLSRGRGGAAQNLWGNPSNELAGFPGGVLIWHPIPPSVIVTTDTGHVGSHSLRMVANLNDVNPFGKVIFSYNKPVFDQYGDFLYFEDPAPNLSGATAITFAVKSSKIGPRFRLELKPSAGEGYSILIPVTIAAVDTYQDVFFDISAIPDAEKNEILEIRLVMIDDGTYEEFTANIDDLAYEIVTPFDERIAWPFPPSDRLIEGRKFETNIHASDAVYESRESMLDTPRYMSTITSQIIGSRRVQYAANIIRHCISGRIFAPLWLQLCTLGSPVTPGDLAIGVTTTNIEFLVNGTCLLWKDPYTWEVLYISAIATNSLTVTEAITNAYSATDLCFPCYPATMGLSQDISRPGIQYIEALQLNFEDIR